MEKKIAFVVAPEGFRDEEYFEPKEYFEEQGLSVITFSKGNVEKATGKLGGETQIDDDYENINTNDYDALVFAGGPGAKESFMEDQHAHDLVNKFYNENKIVGAICIAPTIFAKAGILNNKKATVFNTDGFGQSVLEEENAQYTGEDVEEDGNIVTGNGPNAAKEFAKKIVEKLNN